MQPWLKRAFESLIGHFTQSDLSLLLADQSMGHWHQWEEEAGVRVGKVTKRVTAVPLWLLLISARSAQSPYQGKRGHKK